jgi:hypothetical protein
VPPPFASCPFSFFSLVFAIDTPIIPPLDKKN